MTMMTYKEMKRSVKRIYGCGSAVILFALWHGSCSDEIHIAGLGDKTDEYEIIDMKINVSTSDLETELDTRTVDEGMVNEGTAIDNTVKDIWVLQYDDKGGKVAEPNYLDDVNQLINGVSIPITRPKDAEKKHNVVVLANTHNGGLQSELSMLTTTKMLSEWTQKYTTQESGYNAPVSEGSKGDLLLNGCQEITSSSERLDVSLFRTMAKITVKVKVAEGMRLNSVQMKSVPSQYVMADQFVVSDPTMSVPYFGTTDLAADQWPSGSQECSFVYYIPRNMRGDTESESEKQKNYGAPSGATHIEIIGATDGGDPFRLKFYLGKDMIKNFDIEPNHHYVLPIEIRSINDVVTDSRVEVIKGRTFEDANAFIINIVPGEGLGQPKYTIPITRVNTYWGSADGDAKYYLDPTDEWIAEVVWQDCGDADMFHFVNPDGTETGNTPHFYEGRGCTSFSIRPTGKTCGNAVIGVRKKSLKESEPYSYLWSWHLWFTDYNPDGAVTSGSGKCVFGVPGGYVYKFDTQYYAENPTACMMDRDLGSLYNAYDESSEQSQDARYFGLYYQYGRKDPIPLRPGNNTLETIVKKYKISDQGQEYIDTVKFVSFSRKAKIKEAIHHPTVFYAGSDNKSWCSEEGTPYLTWGGVITWNTKLLDPSPAGWMMPESNLPFKFGNSMTKVIDHGCLRIFKFTESAHEAVFQLGYANLRTKDTWITKIDNGLVNSYLATGVLMSDGSKKLLKQTEGGGEWSESGWDAGYAPIPIRLIRDVKYGK